MIYYLPDLSFKILKDFIKENEKLTLKELKSILNKINISKIDRDSKFISLFFLRNALNYFKKYNIEEFSFEKKQKNLIIKQLFYTYMFVGPEKAFFIVVSNKQELLDEEIIYLNDLRKKYNFVIIDNEDMENYFCFKKLCI